MMRTELGVDIDLCGVLSHDVSQGVKFVKAMNPLLLITISSCWRICMKSYSQQFIFIPLLHVFISYWFGLHFCIHVCYLKYVMHMPKLGCFDVPCVVPNVVFILICQSGQPLTC